MADDAPDPSAPAPAPSQSEPAAPSPPVQQAAPSEPEAPPPPANLGTQRIHAGLPEGKDVLRLVEKAPDADRPMKDDTTH